MATYSSSKNAVLLILAIISGLHLLVLSDDGQPETSLTEPPSIDDYRMPIDCMATYVTGRIGFALHCQLPLVNYQTNNVNFSAVQEAYTMSLDVVCTSTFGWGSSSFANISLVHLKQLLQLAFVDCHFSVLPASGVFPDGLTYLSFQLQRVQDGDDRPLEVQAGALSTLNKLTFFELTSFHVTSLPSGELCHLQHLISLNLSHNSLNDVSLLGFASCGEHLVSVDVSYNRFRKIGDRSFARLANLQYLLLLNNDIEEVSSEAFFNVTSLRYLNLSHNRLERIYPNTWTPLRQLLVLNVSHNHLIGNLDNGTFQHLDNLIILDVNDNHVDSISMGTFDHMIHLAELYLSANRIWSLSDRTFSSLVALNILYVDDNALSDLTSASLSGLDHLSTLFLKDNVMLNAIHEDTFSCCPRLANLSISNCSLSAVPKVNMLKELEVLDLSANNITYVHNDTFTQMSRLTVVTLRNNRIFHVEDAAFHDNIGLMALVLAGNQLHFFVQNVFVANSKLWYLDVSENYLTATVDLRTNSNLHYLNLSHNQISKLDYRLLPSSLALLDVSYNLVQSIEHQFKTAYDYVRLQFLYMSHNHLENVTRTSFSKYTKVLQLSNNRISYIEDRAFAQMKDLMFVDLSYNRLVTLYPGALEVQASSKLNRPRFFLQGNFMNCDCDTRWLQGINDEFGGPNRQRLYGFVYDLSTLFCWTPQFGGGERNVKSVSLLTKTAEDRFLCTFQEHSFSDPLCRRVGPNRTICELSCPAPACDCYRDFTWSNIIVYCSSANISSVPADIPISVTVLYLDGNTIGQLALPYLPSLTHLYANDTGLTDLSRDVFAETSRLLELHLERNALRYIRVGTFDGLSQLTLLDLSSNALSHLQEDVFRPLRSLTTLRLADNRLVNFPVWTLSEVTPRLTAVSLSKNPWACDCNYTSDYRTWLQKFAHIVSDVDNLFCMPSENETSSVPLIAFNASHCFDSSVSIFNSGGISHLPLLVGLLSTLATLSLLSVLVYAYRQEMQVLIYSRYHLRLFQSKADKDDVDPDKLYDAFVSYSSLDETFVVEELLPRLEVTPQVPYKLCLHHRNFIAGAFIMDSILEAVAKSRRTILVLSENFVQSEWCRFEFKSAHLQMLKDKRNRVIVLLLGNIPAQLDPEMKLYLKTNTYLQWGDRLFWQKMYFALPELPKPEN